MRIGIAFDLKPDAAGPGPDDRFEEFDSPETVAFVAGVIRSMGHDPVELGDGRAFLEKMLAVAPDLVFNFAEGEGTSRSREARVPAVCEMLGVPFTGSDPMALAVALDKDAARRLAESYGVFVPRGVSLRPPPGRYDGDGSEFAAVLDDVGLTFPVIVKPVCEGSSKGVRAKSLCRDAAALGSAIAGVWADYGQSALVEEFISGEEITVGLLGNDPPRVLPPMRVLPKGIDADFIYSLEVKRDWRNRVSYEVPAALPRDVLDLLEDAALMAWDAFGCRDVARVDFRVRDGVPYFIEANPLPGLNPASSDLMIIARNSGMTPEGLVEEVIRSALARHNLG